jgi:hypothetical protein
VKWKIVFIYFHNSSEVEDRFIYFHNSSEVEDCFYLISQQQWSDKCPECISVDSVFSNSSTDVYGPSVRTVEPHAAANKVSIQE